MTKQNQTHRAETERFQKTVPNKAAPAERSWRGVLRGHVPSKSLSADSEILCAHTSGRRSKVGEKSDSFSRAERTRPFRPCVPLAVLQFWKHSGGMFSTVLLVLHNSRDRKDKAPLKGVTNFLSLCCGNWRTRHAVSLRNPLQNCKNNHEKHRAETK